MISFSVNYRSFKLFILAARFFKQKGRAFGAGMGCNYNNVKEIRKGLLKLWTIGYKVLPKLNAFFFQGNGFGKLKYTTIRLKGASKSRE